MSEEEFDYVEDYDEGYDDDDDYDDYEEEIYSDYENDGEYKMDTQEPNPGNSEFPRTLAVRDVHYTFPSRATKTGTLTHRMKYEPNEVEDVEKRLKSKIGNLDYMLQIGPDDCTVLLIHYQWNDQKLLEDYTTKDQEELRNQVGLSIESKVDSNAPLLEKSQVGAMCYVCLLESTEENPLLFFHLQNCDHKYCVDCYIQYVKEKNDVRLQLITCIEPSCGLVIRPCELRQLDEYNMAQIEKNAKAVKTAKETEMQKLLTEEQIRLKYQDDDISSDDDAMYENEEAEEEKEVIDEDNLFNFHERSVKRKQAEKEEKRNHSLYLKYWFNVVGLYTMANPKLFKSCPATDCDSVIEYLGFDSDEVTSVGEYIKRMYIPIVECTNSHRFCYSCGKEDHAPMPCLFVKKWIKTCEDDTETAHWLDANTKDCPRCQSAIEKDGGCNHMTCKSCRYEFCWICIGDWKKHRDNYNCDQFNDEDALAERKKQDTAREFLTRYLFYVNLFDIHRTSLKKDKDFLAKLEHRVQKIQQTANVSWIEAHFYRESIDVLLRGRVTLMWTYALLYYVVNDDQKKHMQRYQSSLSAHVEELSKLFEVTEVQDVMKSKSRFLSSAGFVKNQQQDLISNIMDSVVNKKCSFTEHVFERKKKN